MALKIYFAGPRFTTYEREWISKIADLLRTRGFDPFAPIENPFHPEDHPEITRQKLCFDMDFIGIQTANAMFVNLNGNEVDDGTATETGVFYELMQTDQTKKGIVANHDDWRQQESGDGKGAEPLRARVHRGGGLITSSLDDAIMQLKQWEDKLDSNVGVKSGE